MVRKKLRDCGRNASNARWAKYRILKASGDLPTVSASPTELLETKDDKLIIKTDVIEDESCNIQQIDALLSPNLLQIKDEPNFEEVDQLIDTKPIESEPINPKTIQLNNIILTEVPNPFKKQKCILKTAANVNNVLKTLNTKTTKSVNNIYQTTQPIINSGDINKLITAPNLATNAETNIVPILKKEKNSSIFNNDNSKSIFNSNMLPLIKKVVYSTDLEPSLRVTARENMNKYTKYIMKNAFEHNMLQSNTNADTLQEHVIKNVSLTDKSLVTNTKLLLHENIIEVPSFVQSDQAIPKRLVTNTIQLLPNEAILDDNIIKKSSFVESDQVIPNELHKMEALCTKLLERNNLQDINIPIDAIQIDLTDSDLEKNQSEQPDCTLKQSYYKTPTICIICAKAKSTLVVCTASIMSKIQYVAGSRSTQDIYGRRDPRLVLRACEVCIKHVNHFFKTKETILNTHYILNGPHGHKYTIDWDCTDSDEDKEEDTHQFLPTEVYPLKTLNEVITKNEDNIDQMTQPIIKIVDISKLKTVFRKDDENIEDVLPTDDKLDTYTKKCIPNEAKSHENVIEASLAHFDNFISYSKLVIPNELDNLETQSKQLPESNLQDIDLSIDDVQTDLSDFDQNQTEFLECTYYQKNSSVNKTKYEVKRRKKQPEFPEKEQYDSDDMMQYPSVLKVECYLCNNKFISEKQLNTHHHEVHAHVKCNMCDFVGTNASALSQHKIDEHNELIAKESRTYVCEYCGVVMSRQCGSRHVNMHFPDSEVVCEICGKMFYYVNYLVEHKLRAHSDKIYKCDLCEKTFRIPKHLRQHMVIHTGEKPYECNICHLRFSRSSNLFGHKRIHTNSYPYKCVKCPQSFRHNVSRKTHELRCDGTYDAEAVAKKREKQLLMFAKKRQQGGTDARQPKPKKAKKDIITDSSESEHDDNSSECSESDES